MKSIAAESIAPELEKILLDADRDNTIPRLKNSNGTEFVILKSSELGGLRETNYLLSSKKNARILKQSLEETIAAPEKGIPWRDFVRTLES